MKISFYDNSFNYSLISISDKPLGGTQSAVINLIKNLKYENIQLVSGNDITIPNIFYDNDYIVVVSDPSLAFNIKPFLNPKTKLILWTGQSFDQPISQTLKYKQVVEAWDKIVFVSNWQKINYQKVFPYIKDDKCLVINNGGNSVFYQPNLIKNKPIAAYTSTPFRGLEVLLKVWPLVIKEVPDAQLKIFSNMKLYNQKDEYSDLYKQLQLLPNVFYKSVLPQKELAKELQDVSVLAYPNTWEETSCISLIEAMLSGLHPVITDIGALSETIDNKYGSIVNISGNNTSKGWSVDDKFIRNYSDTLIEVFKAIKNNKYKPYKMIEFANNKYNWSSIADKWDNELFRRM